MSINIIGLFIYEKKKSGLNKAVVKKGGEIGVKMVTKIGPSVLSTRKLRENRIGRGIAQTRQKSRTCFEKSSDIA